MLAVSWFKLQKVYAVRHHSGSLCLKRQPGTGLKLSSMLGLQQILECLQLSRHDGATTAFLWICPHQ